jgi:outer membrane protein assembly factor BamB
MTVEGFLGVNADDGELLCFLKHRSGGYRVNAQTPLYQDGRVFISSGYGYIGSVILNLKVNGDKVELSKAWTSGELDNHHGGVILVDGYLYGAAHRFNHGKWICLDWDTGAMKYAQKSVGTKGSATCADGLLYIMSENRDVGLVKPTPEGHDIISEFTLPRGGKGKTWAHPVVCGGRLYLRHGNLLYAYDVKDRGAESTGEKADGKTEKP